eukprot:jgi/Tetstr1/420479/TSEL_011592.t1
MFAIEKRSNLKLKPPCMRCDRPIAEGIQPPLPDRSFFMGIMGTPGSGKTSFAVSLLTDKNAYRGKFNHVELVLPASSLASIGNKAIQHHDKVHNDLDYETLEGIHQRAEEHTKDDETTLVLIDDFSASLKQNDLQKLFKHIVLARRHLRMSIMMISQTYNSIPLNLRKNLSWVAMFRPVNKAEYRGIFSELIWMEEKKADALMAWLFHEPYDFMLLDVTRNLFHRRFDQIAIKEEK